MSVAIITGASRGLGRALARHLGSLGWSLVLDARGAQDLAAVRDELDPAMTVALTGDVSDPEHRRRLINEANSLGGPDLLVNNASHLGPSPLPPVRDHPIDDLRRVYDVNVFAPVALLQDAMPSLRTNRGTVVNLSSDAAVEAYEGWGGYGSAKSALDHLSAVIGVEEPDLLVYAFDPGDMRTAMHQAAFPGEDISDRPMPEAVVPALVRLLEERLPSGRYHAADLLTPAGASR